MTPFSATGQLTVGVAVCTVSAAFWTLGCFTIRGAAAWPWAWTATAFIFHASMFALLIAAYSIVATALSHRATERVESHVTTDVS